MNSSYPHIVSTLEQLNIPLSVSEVHGLCCGLLCSQTSGAAKTRWFTELLDSASLSAADVSGKAVQLKHLDGWFTHTLEALNDADLDFNPLMPEDETTAVVRIRALGDFCAGFTYGVGLTLAARSGKALPADTREIIEDFQAIDAVDSADQVDDQGDVLSKEAQESLYVELLEYVRWVCSWYLKSFGR